MGKKFWAPCALKDVQDIIAYVQKDSPRFAESLFLQFMEAPDKLDLDLRFGWMVPEFELDHVRELLLYSYRIIYEIRRAEETEEEAAYFVAVIHGSRDLRRHYRPPR